MIWACVKWTGLRPEVDPLRGTVTASSHGEGFSESDRAAVEVALQLGAARGIGVSVLCAGPASADPGLREMLAAGADVAVRVDGDGDEGSAEVASRLAMVIAAEEDEPLVVCGDLSADRGSGSVPAFLAHELAAAQALGLVALDPTEPGTLSVIRRLDGGRRERLEVQMPAVISVEGSVADLRRASLAAVLSTRDAAIEVHVNRTVGAGDSPRLRPWRPRARVVSAPSGATALERIVTLSGAFVERTPPMAVALEPEQAAAAILEQLRDWGYLAGNENGNENGGDVQADLEVQRGVEVGASPPVDGGS